MITNAKHERNAGGVIIIGGREVADTLQCPHCQMHFVSIKGSGRLRGFCTKCMAVTCGKISCNACMPFEKKLEAFEKGEVIIL